MLLADFVRRADRRGTSERTSGGKAVTGATGSICHHRERVKRIFKLFLGGQPRFSRFPPVFRLFVRTGETTKLPPHKNFQPDFRLRAAAPKKRKIFASSQNGTPSRCEFALCAHSVDFPTALFRLQLYPAKYKSIHSCIRLALPTSCRCLALPTSRLAVVLPL
jgi:hypothetical protein